MPIATQLREIFNALGDGLFIADANGRYCEVNPAGCEMLGYSEAEFLQLTLPEVVDPSELPRLEQVIAQMADGRLHRSEWLFRRKDGSTFVGELVGGQLPDGHYQSIVRDVTERRALEDHERILRQEAAHRAKNVLSVVQAILHQSHSFDPATYVSKFEERISALAASHDLFIRSAWEAIGLDELVRAQLKPFLAEDAGRLRLSGLPVELAPPAAQAIGMALHELATNAAKYGALADENGRIEVSWQTDESAEQPMFTLIWRELDGPAVPLPGKAGFGSRMIVQMAQRALNGRSHLDFASTGLVWTLTCNRASLTKGSAG